MMKVTPRKLDGFPERQNIGRPVGSKYDQFLDGSIWELKQGIDFEGEPSRFIRSMRQHANSRRGLGVKAMIGTDGRTVILQAKPKSR
jgi:hypothetical protein